jgi:hypothetical protein
VDDKVLELKVYVDDLMAKHLAAADPHTQYAPKASPTFTGTPKAPTAAAGTIPRSLPPRRLCRRQLPHLNLARALKR